MRIENQDQIGKIEANKRSMAIAGNRIAWQLTKKIGTASRRKQFCSDVPIGNTIEKTKYSMKTSEYTAIDSEFAAKRIEHVP